MIYITGDTHRDMSRLDYLDLAEDDLVIVLGDVGINYMLDESDKMIKRRLSQLPCKFFFLRGNHEERPENIDTYKLTEVEGIVEGKAWIEEEFPNLMFADNGYYIIGGKRCLVINGAYSVDKYYRLATGNKWFQGEELTDEEMENIIAFSTGEEVDCILSHTCPEKFEPKEMYLPGLDQSTVSHRMEEFLDKIEEIVEYNKWYCGHWHTDKEDGKMVFMYRGIKDFMEEEK